MKIKKIEKESHILVSSYAITATGINIKRLANIILASPLKSYTTITQALGRAIRLHISKDTANVYDIVDAFTEKCIFAKQYLERLRKSYESEGFEINERSIRIS